MQIQWIKVRPQMPDPPKPVPKSVPEPGPPKHEFLPFFLLH